MSANNNPQPPRRDSYLTFILALLFGTGIVCFLLLVSGWVFLLPVAALGVIAVFALLHYKVWGQRSAQRVVARKPPDHLTSR